MAVIATLDELKIGDTVTWSHYSVVQPVNVNEALIVGFSNGYGLRDTAQAAVNHANVYSSIPVGNVVIPNDYRLYDYIVLQKLDYIDETDPQNPIPVYITFEIGRPWIIPSSITRHNRETLVLQIEDFDTNKLDAIIRILKNNGFIKYSYEILS